MNHRMIVALRTSVAFVLLAHPAPAAEERVLQEWAFDQAGVLDGWQPNGHVTEAAVSGGRLTCRTTGADPILELTPLLNLPATPWQVLEVTLQADRDGVAEWFWSNTERGPLRRVLAGSDDAVPDGRR